MVRTSSITVLGDRASHASYRRESVMFLSVCLFFVTLWNDEVCDNGNSVKQCNFQNSYYGVIAYAITPQLFVVVHLYLTSLWIPRIYR